MIECRVCGAAAAPAGSVHGRLRDRDFALAHCDACGYGFVVEPWTEYAAIYSDAYYEGRGADPLVDYVFELEHADTTVRRHEWRGILEAVRGHAPVPAGTAWLDFGCGTGGLVQHLRAEGIDAVGFEQGWSVPRLRERGVPLLEEEELEGAAGRFAVITAIEVLEHVVDPVAELRRIASLLAPGGVLFLTTGNAAPYADKLAQWRYVIPEIHVSFFEPRTLEHAMRAAGLDPRPGGFNRGWTDIIRFKALKNLKRHTVSPLERVVPWSLVAPALDARLGLSAHPVGYRRADEGDAGMTVAALRERLAPPLSGGADAPFEAYAEAIDVNWSAELEALHEESSRDHFIDIATRGGILDGIAGRVGPGDVVVDVGCSTGYLLEDLRAAHPESTLVGIDLVAEGLRKAHAHVPEALLLLADCTQLPLPDQVAAAVVSANVLEHVPDDVAALREMFRMLAPGGRAAVVVPAGPGLYDYYDRFLDHERRYARGELAAKGREAGLKVVSDGVIGGFLYPAFWAVKKRNRAQHKHPSAEERQALVTRDIQRTQSSAVGAKLTRAERALRRNGVNLPVGVRSLVVFERPT